MPKAKAQVKSKTVKEHVEQFIGENLAVLCCRYVYRGTLTEAHDDFMVLANASAVEETGAAKGDHPQHEDVIGGSITILYAAIEILFQPSWCFAPIEGSDTEDQN